MIFRNLATRSRGLWLITLLACCWSYPGSAQAQTLQPQQSVQAQQAEKPVIGAPGEVLAHGEMNFADLARKEKLRPAKRASRKYEPFRHPPKPATLPPGAIIKFSPASAPSATGGPMVESATTPVPRSPDLNAGFVALLDNQTFIPPDTQGTVGPTQLMVTLNSQVAVQDRAGNNQNVVSLDTFWASVRGPAPPNFNNISTSDPRVVYDPYSSRWITAAMAYPESVNAGVLVGASATSDANAGFHLYKVAVDGTKKNFCDFPTLGFNNKWVVVMCNIFSDTGGYVTGRLFIFNKATLYAGGNAVPTVIDTGGDSNVTPASTYDNNPATPEYLVEEFNGDANGLGSMRLFTITGPVTAPVLKTVSFPSTSLTWNEFGPNNFAPQAGGVGGIDTGAAQTGNVIYRSDGTIWTAHTVFLPAGAPNRSSVQWWELDTGGNVLQRGLIDTPDASVFRAYPTIGVNKFDDALIGYSEFSPNGFASAYYSFRGHADPPSTLQNEAPLHAGQGPYFDSGRSGASNRWGDYSNTAVDPLDDTALWTIQEFAYFSNLWGTWWGEVVPPGPPASFSVVPNPMTTTAGVPLTDFMVTVLDAAGHRVTGYQGTIHFISSDPLSSLPADYTFSIPDDGTHHFPNLTLFKSGTQTITVTDVNNGTIQGAATLTVFPGPFASLVTQAPATTVAGVPFNFRVTAKDAYQNVVTGYSDTVQFGSNDPMGTFSPSSYTFAPADAGTHSFSATLRDAGAQPVFVSDVNAGTQGGFTISVTPAAAKTLQLAAPPTATKGAPFTLLVTALDQFGNQATGYRGTVGFTSTDPAPSLPANYAFTSGDAGRHPFQVTLNTLGSWTVTATDTVTSTIIGASANISVANMSGIIQDVRVRLGQQFSGIAVATFTDDGNPVASTLSATINWGDGTLDSTTPSISGPSGNGVYTVTGGHQYLRPPEQPITVTVTDNANSPTTLILSGNVRMWPKTESH